MDLLIFFNQSLPIIFFPFFFCLNQENDDKNRRSETSSFSTDLDFNTSLLGEPNEKFKNLNKLLAWGHARVIENILEKKVCENAISDKFGDESLIKNALLKNGRKINLVQRTKAESDLAVAAASILAREEFVTRMRNFELEYKMSFPKGASEKTILAAGEFVSKYGKENLGNIAKLHFKTTSQII